jgi:type II restriction/modification system DNA methylase subunit YeeA
MNLQKLQPREALNKAFLKINPFRNDVENFKNHLQNLLDKITESESEEFHKNLIVDFFKNTFYGANHFINTKGRNDLVIYNGKDAKSSVGVILEFKKPNNKSEMLKVDHLNTRAFQELVLYFLRERLTGKNLEIKYLIATNIYEWFIFDAQTFENLFIGNKSLVKQFTDFEAGRLTSKKTEFFYKEIAQPAIAEITDKITFTHFDIREYQEYLNPGKHPDEHKLISLFKLFSPEHLLKLPFINDSNTLDKGFYSELLHIIGLVETKEGGKKLIQRKKQHDRNIGSLIENAISQVDSLDKISRLEKPELFGETYQEQLFNLGLELAITWMNRILFLKLLEAQLIRYHKNDLSWGFLNLQKVANYDDLNSLFFSVLARKPQERSQNLQQKLQERFAHVPYLNSSLFEPTDIEQETICISNLRNEKLPIFPGTILKDNNGKKLTGEINTLEYLFAFLNAYNFSSDIGEEVQEENKRLINASVLGLIFEKINGYKDGSLFTPGFITMYMCRETIRRAVIQKFNNIKGWNCETMDHLYDQIEDKKAANDLINSLKICDPAVGSGHFLVSALNEMIAIKSELKILLDRQGKRLKEYSFEVANDELIVTDEDGLLFEYNPKNQESQRVQETLFHEKQTIIENCLFGVDINPNSVKICRLRLWIELLKNAYYKTSPLTPLLGGEGNIGELETLPNIDINIKCGNSLISRFSLDADLRVALSKQKYTIEDYKNAVKTYRNAENKEQKRKMERLIQEIKGNFKTSLGLSDPNKTKLRKLEGEVENLEDQIFLLPETKAEKKTREKKIAKLNNEIDKLRVEIEDIEGGKIYENALEWRFEFPEVLNDDGIFVGFDVVIGNPPYIRQEEIKNQKPYLQTNFITYSGTADLYVFFVEKGFKILKAKGQFCYIMPNKWMQAGYGKALRTYILENQLQAIIDFGDVQVFEEATTYPCILNASKQRNINNNFISAAVKTLNYSNGFTAYIKSISNQITVETLNDETWVISSDSDQKLLLRINSKCISLAEYINGEAHYGVKTGLTEAFVISKETCKELISKNNQSLEIIRSFILGRNIKSYTIPEAENYLIKIPKGFTNSFRENQDAWICFSKNYPAVSNYLSVFKDKAEKRTDKGDYWWELRACDYYQEFEKPKIMYQTFQVKPCFIYDEQGLYCNNSMWIISKADKVLLAILNSKMGWWLISKHCTAIQNGFQLIWKYFGQIPIPKFNQQQGKVITSIVDQILNAKKSDPNADTTALETEIDQMVYQLYNLTAEEIEIIESSQ